MSAIVVNLFGAPGSGKSVAAAYVFSQLKMKGINCELVTEYAKDCTWEKRDLALDCQEYIFGKQSYRLKRCADKVDVIITDSPLPLGLFYNTDPVLDDNFKNVVINIFNKYCNVNYLLTRVMPYDSVGRNQTQEEADMIGDKIQDFLDDNNIFYVHGIGSIDFYNLIVDEVVSILKLKDRWEAKE